MQARENNSFGGAATRWGALVVTIALGMYPLIVYFGLRYFTTVSIALLVAGLCVVRLLVGRRHRRVATVRPGVIAICAAGILLAAASTVTRSSGAMLFYPVITNVILLAIFAFSLVSPPSVIERIARLGDPDLPPAAIAYTWNVTAAWSVFFLLNGSIALYTALFASIETWALYNGMLAYLLMGAMFLGEWLTRRVVMRKGVRE